MAATGAGSVRDALGAAADALRAAGIGEARFDAEVLLEHATGWGRERLAAEPEREVPATAARLFGEMVRRRLRREPVAYIVGSRWFRHLELRVDRRVLIPRPETEMLVDLALEVKPGRVLDVGTGSGAIALAVADEIPGCEVVACDVSADALTVARANAERLGLADRVRFHAGTVPNGEEFDLVVANLPYVSEPDWESLAPEVKIWEPRGALLAGPDGLDAIRAALPRCVRCLFLDPEQKASAGGTVALEVGEGQAAAVEEMMREAGLEGIESRPDLAGIPRVVVGRRGAGEGARANPIRREPTR